MDSELARVAQELPVAEADRVQVHLGNPPIIRKDTTEFTLDVTDLCEYLAAQTLGQ